MHWDTFGRVRGWVRNMRDMREEKGVPKSLFRLLMTLQQEHDDEERRRADEGQDRNRLGEPQTYYGPWIPRAAYILSRMRNRHEGAIEELKELEDSLSLDKFSAISWIGLAARWADLLDRRQPRWRD